MRPVRSRSQGVPLKSVILLGIVLMPVGLIGVVGTLWELGQIDLPFLHGGEGIPPGTVPVLKSSQFIKAYTKLTRDHILDRQNKITYYYVKPEDIEKGKMLVDRSEILGRVLKHDKLPGYVFTEEDFLPKNTRPGLTGGVPVGRKLMTLDVSKIEGFYGLQLGDHVDLVATFQIEMPKGGGGGAYSTLFNAEAQMATMQKRARVRSLAQDAVLVTAEHIREKPTISKSLSQGTKVKMVPVQEVDIAVKPEEVSLINEALATDVKITAVARSGQPGDDSDAETPGSDPLSEFPITEAVVGNKMGAVIFRPPHNLAPAVKAAKPARPPHRERPMPMPRRNDLRLTLGGLETIDEQSLTPPGQH